MPQDNKKYVLSRPILHNAPSPFPLTAQSLDGKTTRRIVNERCKCGLLRSMHLDTVAFGHGPAAFGPCKKFSWDSFVYEDQTEGQ